MNHVSNIASLVGHTARLGNLRAALKTVMNGGYPTDALGQAVVSWWVDQAKVGNASLSAANAMITAVQRVLEGQVRVDF